MKTAICGALSVFVVVVAIFSFGRFQPRIADGSTDAGDPASTISKLPEDSARTSTVPALDSGSGRYSPAAVAPRDFEALRWELEKQAASGDISALRKLAEINDYCASYSLHLGMGTREVLARKAAEDPNNAGRYMALAERVEQRCRRFAGSASDHFQAFSRYREEAAEAGDIASMIRKASQAVQGEASADALNTLARQALSSGDPAAMLALGDALDGGLSIPAVAELNRGTPVLPQTLQILACRRSGNALCGPTSIRMDFECMSLGHCAYADYEDFVRRAVLPEASHARLDRELAEITNLIPRSVPRGTSGRS